MKWEIKEIDVSKLRAYDKNPRKITEKANSILKNSIAMFGQAIPLVCDSDLTVIGGNQRLKNLSGVVSAMVAKQKLTESQIRRLNIMLNNHIGEFDYLALQSMFDKDVLINELGVERGVLQQYAFNTGEIDVTGDNFAIKAVRSILLKLPTGIDVDQLKMKMMKGTGKVNLEEALVVLIDRYYGR
jgi:hypothetical protein